MTWYERVKKEKWWFYGYLKTMRVFSEILYDIIIVMENNC